MKKIEWKVGDKLECINISEYLDIDKMRRNSRQKLLDSSLVIDHIYDGGGLGIMGCELCVPYSDYKYFKKKESEKEYDFNDLIDVANKAYEDGLIDYKSDIVIGSFDREIRVSFVSTKGKIKETIDFIQSLYKEKFVIECEDDLKRIKFDARINLNGGQPIKFLNNNGSYEWYIENVRVPLPLSFVKGATVEQSR